MSVAPSSSQCAGGLSLSTSSLLYVVCYAKYSDLLSVMSNCEVLTSESVSAQLSEHLLPLVIEEILICVHMYDLHYGRAMKVGMSWKGWRIDLWLLNTHDAQLMTAVLQKLSRPRVGGCSSSEGQECRVISEQTFLARRSLHAAVYLGQDWRLGLSTLYFKAVLSGFFRWAV